MCEGIGESEIMKGWIEKIVILEYTRQNGSWKVENDVYGVLKQSGHKQ